MRRIMLVLLLVQSITNAIASTPFPKRSIDSEFNTFVQKLIEMEAICNSEISEYEGGYHKFYQFVIDKGKKNLITNFESKGLYPYIASAYCSDIRKAGTLAKFVSIGYGKDNKFSYNLGAYKDRKYDILFIRDPQNSEKRYVYALIWWLKSGMVNGTLMKFYNFDPVIQREKTDSINNRRSRGIRMEDTGLTYLDATKLGKVTDFDINQNTSVDSSATVLNAVSAVCTAYISIAFSNKKPDNTRDQRIVLASRLVTLCTKGSSILKPNDRKTCIKLIENLQTCETDSTNDTLLGAAITLLKNK